MALLSIIIPVHNGGSAFEHCLSSISASTTPPDEIIVVADGETDGVWRLAEQYGARVLKNDQTYGPAFARNKGARVATGDLLFFVDADVVIRPTTVERIKKAFEQDPELSALIGSYDDTPAEPGFLSQYRNLLHHYTHQTAQLDASTFWGACGAIRREAFWAVDGFDERYRQPCVEDIELGYRLKRSGYRIQLRRDIQVTHLKRWSAGSMIKTDMLRRALPWTELLLRYRRFENDLNLRTANRLSMGAIAIFIISFVAGFEAPEFFFISVAMCAMLFALNAPFYLFLRRKKGVLFSLAVVPWHWMFYVYSGIASLLGVISYVYSSAYLLRKGKNYS